MGRRFAVLVLVLISVGCTASLSETAVAGDPHPCNGPYESCKLYLWYRGEHEDYNYYMNADAADPQAEPSDQGTMVSTGTARYSAFFVQDPRYDLEELYLDTNVNIVATLHLELSRSIDDVTGAMRDRKNAEFIGSETKPGLQGDQLYTFSFSVPSEVVANSLEFQVFLDLKEFGTVSYTFHTDGTSFIVLPLLRDTDSDGDPDRYDEDDDNDGFSDTEEQVAGTDPLDIFSFPEDGGDDGGDGGGDGGVETWVYVVTLVVVVAVAGAIAALYIRRRYGE